MPYVILSGHGCDLITLPVVVSANSGEDNVRGSVARRQDAILAYVVEHGRATIEELSLCFSTSRMIAHGSARLLVERGAVRKGHGGLSALASGTPETCIAAPPGCFGVEKSESARAAADRVEARPIIVPDDSSTSVIVSEQIPRTGPIPALGRISRMRART
ncbi:hypothetical protein AA103196_2235 [Ameyamaea chiangmaiensis NBRC 103196]|uniref:Uncharacterized protein n=1 Tax=Ameyamaea chiangmaiensis TaxID=442969 RepID=A0A850P7H5_9PROT|nr:hypothetical protein [Ameyamaea chiangmaiensis]MBS4075505.1 hypothetical protein [Ameyamaea chiangmaiensis]NVN38963.1 hypothetical protein [Ameyamaea chiangmaiensis]GBQ69503.1 hypothetical protein AA103196_2235 [Ameyamaea chiangmaiensis NBRC 103196]